MQRTRPSMHQPPCGNYSRAGLISSTQASERARVGLIQGWEEIQQIWTVYTELDEVVKMAGYTGV